MSISVMDHVWKHSIHSGTELLMLLAIADNCNDECAAFPSVRTLARKCRMTERNARMLLKHLVQSGELEVIEGGGKETIHGPTNLYIIHLDRMPERHGVKPTSGVKSTSGVKPTSVGGEIYGSNGVKPTSPLTIKEPSVNRQLKQQQQQPDAVVAGTIDEVARQRGRELGARLLAQARERDGDE